MTQTTAKSSKVDKNELKRLMREEKAKRIESPLAKYNSIGQLTCVICNQIIKSELFWTAHINGKAHLQQVELLKASTKAKTVKSDEKKSENNSFKRPLPVEINETEVKKVKIESAHDRKMALINQYDEEEEEEEEKRNESNKAQQGELDIKIGKMQINASNDVVKAIEITNTSQTVDGVTETTITTATSTTSTNALPEGFFDDRKKDAKARNVDYSANLESEWSKFKIEIQNEELKNEILTELDDEIRDFDRDLEEVDQLIDKWSRIENLHQLKERLKKDTALAVIENKKQESIKMEQENNEDDDSDSDIDLENVMSLTLRTKNRC